jgi:RimJ/RimL family protein N-acetyltransferase
MTEAVAAVIDWLFEQGWESIAWECFVGNVASSIVARRNGFEYTGEAPTAIATPDGSKPLAWHGVLTPDDRSVKSGWPT